MAYDKIVDSAKLDAALTKTADAIRTKSRTTSQIQWDESVGFRTAVLGITPALQPKSADPSASAQTITPDADYEGLSQVTISAMPEATQATPTITVSTAGLITASSEQAAGYVASGTKSATKQLSTQAAKTVTPTTTDQTAVAGAMYTTGEITVKGDANLIPENIVAGKTIFGVSGTATGADSLPKWTGGSY